MKVKVRFFAVLRDRAGCAESIVETQAGSARRFVDELIESKQLGLPSPLIRIAVNGAFVEDQHELHDGDLVVLIPPVAGG